MTLHSKRGSAFIQSVRKFILGIAGYNDLNGNENYLPDKTLNRFLITMVIIITIEIIVTAALLLNTTNG